MRRLLILLPALALVGCGDGLYYQTRYIPTDIDSAFALSSSSDGEVIELPAAPPDIEGTHPERKDCAHPYQKFKPIGKVQIKADPIRSTSAGDTQLVATYDNRMRLTGPDVSLPAPKVVAYANSPYAPGVTQKAFYQPVGNTDTRPRSTTGAGTDVNPNPQAVNGGLNSKNYDPYCCGDGPGQGTTNAGLGPGH
jgi:hypothetical protein